MTKQIRLTIFLLMSVTLGFAQNDTVYPTAELLVDSIIAKFNTSDLYVTWEFGYCAIDTNSGDTTFAPCYTVTYSDHYVTDIELCPENLDSVGGMGLHLGDPYLLDSNLFRQMEIDGSNIIYNSDDYGVNYKNLTTSTSNDGGGANPKYCIEADLFLGTSDPWYQTYYILTGPHDKTGPAINYHTAEEIGVLLDGVVLEHTPPSSESTAAINGGIIPIDYCGWHPEPSGFGHFHAVPTGINVAMANTGIDTSLYACVQVDQQDNSGLAGFTFSGIPIYGPFDDGQSSAPNDLDECNGHTGTTPDYATAVYHYHVSDSDIINNPPCRDFLVPLVEWEYGEWTAPDQPGAITGTDTVCEGQGDVTFTITAVDRAFSYNWTVPAGATITSSNDTTTTITVTFGTDSTSGSVCVSAENDVGTSADTCFTVVVESCTGTFNGTTDSLWTDLTNWSGLRGALPTCETDVVISNSATNMPKISSTTAYCKSLTIQDGAEVLIDMASGALEVCSD